MRILLVVGMILAVPMALHSKDINFGNNSSEWAHDDLCDDPRFRGAGMDPELDNIDIGKDASDCQKGFLSGNIKLWVEAEASAATQCSAIKFGNNSSAWAKDGFCDDARFAGPGAATIVSPDDNMRDAKDCKALCEAGQVFLRDY